MSAPPPRSPEPSVRALAARVAALEARLTDLEGPHSETMYRMRREVTSVRITLGRMAAHAGVPAATDEDIDIALDEET